MADAIMQRLRNAAHRLGIVRSPSLTILDVPFGRRRG